MSTPVVVRVQRPQVVVLAFVFVAAVCLRVSLAGVQRATSVPAGLVFAAVLVAASALCRARPRLSRRAAAVGVAGAVLLVVPAWLHVGIASVRPQGSFAAWAALTTVVAGAEEAFLRGALFDAVTRWRGTDAAVVVGAVAFALLHVPMYGWHVLPVDLAVGVALGALRLVAGSWAAPAIAHVGADLAGWWLV